MSSSTRALSDHEVVNGLLADYGGLLYESAYLLAAVAEAPEASRIEEFDVLTAVASEGSEKHFQLVQRLSSDGTRAGDESQRLLVSRVHALFEVVTRIGEALACGDTRDLPATVIEDTRLIRSVSKALARALEMHQDPAEIERCLWAVQLGVQALDRQLAAAPHPLNASPSLP